MQEQNKKGNPKDADEQRWQFREVSRIALRNGVLPVALFLLYIMNSSENTAK